MALDQNFDKSTQEVKTVLGTLKDYPHTNMCDENISLSHIENVYIRT